MSKTFFSCPGSHSVYCDDDTPYRVSGKEFAAIHPCVRSNAICNRSIRQVKSEAVNRCQDFLNPRLAKRLSAGQYCPDQSFAQNVQDLLTPRSSAELRKLLEEARKVSPKGGKGGKGAKSGKGGKGGKGSKSGKGGKVSKESKVSPRTKVSPKAILPSPSQIVDAGMGAVEGAAGAAAVLSAAAASGLALTASLDELRKRMDRNNTDLHAMIDKFNQCHKCGSNFDHTSHLPFNLVCQGCNTTGVVCLSCLQGPLSIATPLSPQSPSGSGGWFSSLKKEAKKKLKEGVKQTKKFVEQVKDIAGARKKYDVVANGQGMIQVQCPTPDCQSLAFAVLSLHSLMLAIQTQPPSVYEQFIDLVKNWKENLSQAEEYIIGTAKVMALDAMAGK